MTPAVRTVLGDVTPEQLGPCDAHDNLFLSSPALPGEELDDPDAALHELRAFAAAGGRCVVQWTPWGMTPRLDALPELSRRAGVHIVAATGLHQAKHYTQQQLHKVYDQLPALFVDDLTTAPVRAGIIKVAGAYHRLDEHARHVMTAAAEAHHATGAPIGVHLEAGTAAMDVLDLLCDHHAVQPGSVILGHVHRFPDHDTHRAIAEAGAYLTFDGPSRTNHATDWRLPQSLKSLADAGHLDRILLGADTVTATARSTADGPGMPHLLTALRPMIENTLGPEAAVSIFVTNPAAAFTLRPPPSRGR